MTRYLFPFFLGLLLALFPTCGAEQHSEEVAGEAASEEAARPLEAAAAERLAAAELLPGSVAGRLRDYVADNSDVFDHTEPFRYLQFEPGKVIVEGDTQALTEIEELGLFLNANPLMNIELVTYADQGGARNRSAQQIADMRGMYLKSRLMDQGVEQQLIDLRSVVLESGAGAEGNRVEVVLKGQ